MTSDTAPAASRRPHERTHHGDTVIDHYEWLRDLDSPEVIAHLESEHAWTLSVTADQEDLREELFAEVVARKLETDLSTAGLRHHDDGRAFWYYHRMVEGQDHALLCRVAATDPLERPALDTPPEEEEILLDCNADAAGHDFYSLGGFDVSPDGHGVARLIDTVGDERYRLVVTDLRTGDTLPDTAVDLGWGVSWLGNDRLSYHRVDDAWRTHQVWLHTLGTPAESDTLVWQEDDERFSIQADTSRDGRHLVLHAASKLTCEAMVLPRDGAGVPRSITGRVPGVDASIEVSGDDVFVVHNRDSLNFDLAHTTLADPDPSTWTVLMSGGDTDRITGVSAYATCLVVEHRHESLTAVSLIRRDGAHFEAPRLLDFPGVLPIVHAHDEADHDTATVRVAHSSPTLPHSVLEVDLATGTMTTLRSTPVLDDPHRGAYRPEDWLETREWAVADDGTRIPVSIIHAAGVERDGTHPCILYGYGSYEHPTDIDFSLERLTLLERGVVFAVAHVRGGGEMGRRWYDEGKLEHKQNTFTDFVACARHLCDRGWTSPERLGARGGSAGGLLVGAATNLAPELFRAVHAAVPFVDALTSMLMPELPLTVGEWEEWGNPLDDADAYAWMRAYTPYENIDPTRHYPAILATTSLNDTRVLCVEPAKWIARLRHELPPEDGRDRLLHIEMAAGHGGVSGRYARWRQNAFGNAWLLAQITGNPHSRNTGDPTTV